MKKILKVSIKVIAFLLVFIALFSSVTNILVSNGYMDYQGIRGFYDERKNSLDAVYIGSSNCLAYWNPIFAWEEYGISVYSYACNTQPFFAVEYLIKEARKTQPDAVFVVNINTLNDSNVSFQQMHKLLDAMPFSLNKLALTKRLADIGEYSFEDRLEFYFPVIRYHSRWKELEIEDFELKVNGMKGAITYSPYLSRIEDLRDSYIYNENTTDLTEDIITAAESLLDYCDKENVEVVFVTVPQTREKANDIKKYNALNELIESRGYPTLCLIDQPDTVNLNLETDFYNNHHTNIHGSVKFTHYVSEYLVENYGFENKRGMEEYSDWEEGYEKYAPKVAPHVLDFEWTQNRNYDLYRPATFLVNGVEDGVEITWSKVVGADGYTLYKKEEYKGEWKRVISTEGGEYLDTDVEKGKTYYYTVAPYSLEDGEEFYGYYKYNGKKIIIE